MTYKAIQAEKANFPVRMMCRCSEVSTSGFYAWRKREPSEHAKRDDELREKIKTIHSESRKTYGSPRVHAELAEDGFEVGRKRVARLMAEEGIVGRQKRAFKKTTDSNHDSPIADNVLNRDFEVDAPDKAWVADITYIRTHQGWLYLAVIIDLYSRRVVGWSMAEHMRTELVLNALGMALGSRDPHPDGLVFHSDQGSQYAAADYRDALAGAGITCSMSRRANCWDNAVAESFFSTLKTELIYRIILLNPASAKTIVAEWIEVFYNGQRRHSSIAYLAPREYERRFYDGVRVRKSA
jgi:transposase InsO family protein